MKLARIALALAWLTVASAAATLVVLPCEGRAHLFKIVVDICYKVR